MYKPCSGEQRTSGRKTHPGNLLTGLSHRGGCRSGGGGAPESVLVVTGGFNRLIVRMSLGNSARILNRIAIADSGSNIREDDPYDSALGTA
jgi:hypothetical protein